jgi:NADPH:quinone reductase-like Zn-dependent oxidoreductase
MRAVIVNGYGQTPVLGALPATRPGLRQVLKRVRTPAVNLIDRRLGRGDRRILFPGAMEFDAVAVLPAIGTSGLVPTTMLGPLDGSTILVVGARGGVGSIATQFAARAGAHVIAVAPDSASERMHRYGAAEIIDRAAVAVPEAVQRAHPDGIHALIDCVSDTDRFASPAKLVRPGGSAFGVPMPPGLIDHSPAGSPRARPGRRGHLRLGQAEIIML